MWGAKLRLCYALRAAIYRLCRRDISAEPMRYIAYAMRYILLPQNVNGRFRSDCIMRPISLRRADNIRSHLSVRSVLLLNLFALRNMVALLAGSHRNSPCFFISAPRCTVHRTRFGASTTGDPRPYAYLILFFYKTLFIYTAIFDIILLFWSNMGKMPRREIWKNI